MMRHSTSLDIPTFIHVRYVNWSSCAGLLKNFNREVGWTLSQIWKTTFLPHMIGWRTPYVVENWEWYSIKGWNVGLFIYTSWHGQKPEDFIFLMTLAVKAFKFISRTFFFCNFSLRLLRLSIYFKISSNLLLHSNVFSS